MTMEATEIVACIQEFAKHPTFGGEITRFAELAPGIVAAEDTLSECDTYFDTKRWRFTYPDIWLNGSGTPTKRRATLTEQHQIDILPGAGQRPTVSNFNEMMMMAQQHLQPRIGQDRTWHNAPKPLQPAPAKPFF